MLLSRAMEKIQRHNVSLNTPAEQQLMSSTLRDSQNSATKNKTTQKGALVQKKMIKRKKNIVPTPSQESTVSNDTKTNNSNSETVTDNGYNNVLTKTTDVPNTSATEVDNLDHVSKTISQIFKESTTQTIGVKKKKKTKNKLNSSAKEDMATDMTSNPSNKSPQIISNEDCNHVSVNGTTIMSNIMKRESTDEMKNNATLAHAKFKHLKNINYEFHEANHAIIDTFSVSLDFFLRNDSKQSYCLVCDTNLQLQNDDVRKLLCGHIRSKEHVHLLSIMTERDKKSKNNGKFFSKLTLAREYIISNEGFIKCFLCYSKGMCCDIKNNDRSLYEHIRSNAHRDAKVSWELQIKDALQYIHNQFQSRYNAKLYRCEFCNYQSSLELHFVKHLLVPYHTTRLMELLNHAKNFKFFFCNICRILWFGSENNTRYHFEQIEHKHSIIYGPDINILPKQIVQFLVMCKQNAEVLFERSNCAYHDQMIKLNHVLYNFENDLRKYIPNIKTYPFGSRISNLSFPESDIDVFLDCNNTYEGKHSSHLQSQKLILSVVQYLSYNRKLWIVHDVILHSRTPIAKVRHIPSGLICDVSVTNGLAVENTKIIKCFNHVFPPCRKLILFLKQWLHLSDLLGSHLITSYALTWCVIFYLQTLLVFPSISDLIKLKNKSWLISGWEVGVSHDFRVNGLNHTFEELLLGFFLFYAKFKYKKQIVCPLLGRPLKKNAFKLLDLPQEMAPYIAYMRAIDTQEKRSRVFSVSPLCVQDPFDLSHNLTKAVNNKDLKTFQNNCAISAKLLKTTLPNVKSPFMPYSN